MSLSLHISALLLAFCAASAFPLSTSGSFPIARSMHPAAAYHIENIRGVVFPAPQMQVSSRARQEFNAYDYRPIPPRYGGHFGFFNGAANIPNVQSGTMYRVKYKCPSGVLVGCNCHGLSCARMQGTWILPDGTCQCDYWGTESGCSETSGVDIVCSDE